MRVKETVQKLSRVKVVKTWLDISCFSIYIHSFANDVLSNIRVVVVKTR